MRVEFTDIRNPHYLNAEGTQIGCNIDFRHLNEGFVFFVANKNDVEDHGREIFDMLVNGNFGPIAPYVAPPPLPQKTARQKLMDRFSAEEIAELKKMLKE